jgi:hypothetical protein
MACLCAVGLFGGDAQTPSVIASDVIDGHCTLRQQDLVSSQQGSCCLMSGLFPIITCGVVPPSSDLV